MKRSEMLEIIKHHLKDIPIGFENYDFSDRAEDILNGIEKAGMSPPYDEYHMEHCWEEDYET